MKLRKSGFALALASAIAMTVVPVTPSLAGHQASPAKSAVAQSRLVAAITTTQMEALAKSQPRLYKKILTYNSGAPIAVTPAEGRTLQALSKQTLGSVKGGSFFAALLAALGTPVGLVVVEYTIKLLVGDATQSSVVLCFFTRLIGLPSAEACGAKLKIEPTNRS